ncbi:MAG: UDP-N-acetylmuramoyl-L-alanyl-D-glutamate--2,6-diaminopimelate ligase [Phycisphaeraceae bacterium]|nr:UDP-N-acetylmuramoyl-L-alanyl-D-glutamate--2,6-diaminopimelate ligase [Phycisphaeraceae bacterium]
MRLAALIDGCNCRPLGKLDPVITDITDDSRQVRPGALYIARRGKTADGRAFIPQAVAAGALAVLTDDAALAQNHPSLAFIQTDDVQRTSALLAERFFANPSRALTLIAVTGTNGKTTVATAVAQALNAAGTPCGLIGTVEIHDGRAATPARLTTPSAVELSRALAAMVANGCTAAAIEASSHALDQDRVAALDINIGVFTNLTGDHLDYHVTMDNYAKAKSRLFDLLPASGVAIANFDDPAAESMVRRTRARILRCSARGHHTCRVEILRSSIEGMHLRCTGPWGAFDTHTTLIGAHNAMNLLQVAAACHAAGLDRVALQHALAAVRPPRGRLERINLDAGPAVFVDYAHTDDALERAIEALRPLRGLGKLWVVFGCGGDRDRTKRPRMGRVASRLADVAVITSDNPRTEDPMRIIREIQGGIDHEARAIVHVDRAEAIRAAIAQAEPADIILIAGKGHEREQLLPDGQGGIVRRDFDDADHARAALARRAHALHAGAARA